MIYRCLFALPFILRAAISWGNHNDDRVLLSALCGIVRHIVNNGCEWKFLVFFIIL